MEGVINSSKRARLQTQTQTQTQTLQTYTQNQTLAHFQSQQSITQSSSATPVSAEDLQVQQDIDHLRHDRLHTLDSVYDAFNVCDVDTLYKLIHQRCHPDIVFSCGGVTNSTLSTPTSSSSSNRNNFIGRNAIFIFWNFAHETYPDAMLKILERRMALPASVASASQQLSSASQPSEYLRASQSMCRVECVYKFTGTRITSTSVYDIFAEFMTSNPLSSTMTSSYDDLTLSMVRFVTSGGLPPTTLDADEAKNCIMEAILTFDPSSNLIKEWSIELLAGDDR